MTLKRVALVYRSDSSFVQRDREILRSAFRVTNVCWQGKRSIPRLALSVLRSDAAFSWFALDHAYGACRLARLFGKRSLVVVGGVDAARRPDMNYGVHLDPRMGPRSRYALAHSDRVLVVDESLRQEIRTNTGIDRPDIVTVHLGFDTDVFSPDDGPKRNVLTVGIVDDVNLARKGLMTFVKAAAKIPDLPFVLVGGRPNEATDKLRSLAPANLDIRGRLTHEELIEQYRRAKVYVQASRYEGLPTALGEAMACACVPVGTRIAGIPTLMGETGYYVPPDDPEATALAIRKAFDLGDGKQARARIIERFAVDRRRRLLIDLVNATVEGRIEAVRASQSTEGSRGGPG